MTSANSLKNNGFIPTFKNVFKRYFPLFIIVQILTAVFSAVISRIGTDYITEMVEMWAEFGSTHDITVSFVTAFTSCVMGAGMLGMLLIAVLLFREIYSKRASTFSFSMPVKRGAYFNANMLFGLCTLITAFVIRAATVLISVNGSEGFQKGVLLFNTAQFLKCGAAACMCVAVLYAIYMLCAVLAGRVWHYLVLCYIAVISVNMGAMGLATYFDSIWGFHVEKSPTWVLSPTGVFGEAFNGNVELKYIIALILQFAVVYAVGYAVFKRRKAEVAEVSVSGKLVPAILIAIALLSTSFTGLAAGSLSFLGITVTSFSVLIKICIAVVSAVIVTILLTAIFYKKAFTKTTAKCLAVTVAVTLIVVAFVEFTPSGFKNYVPAAEDVETVTLNENYDYYYDNSFTSNMLNLFGLDDYIYYGNSPVYSFSGDEAKARVEELHKKMVDENTVKNYGSEDFLYHGFYSVNLTYKLKNGKTVTRAYCVGNMDIFDEYIALMQTEEAVRQNSALALRNENILFIGVADNRVGFDPDEYKDYYDDDFYIYNPEYGTYKYRELEDYGTVIENIVKDKTAEPRNVFNGLLNYDNYNFYIYDYDNVRTGGDDWIEHYPDYNDFEIMFYFFTDEATDEQKKLMATMTPDEMIEYDYNCEYGGYGLPDPITSEFVALNAEADANTYAYLRSIGIID